MYVIIVEMIVKMMDVIKSVNVIVCKGWRELFRDVSRSEIEYVMSMCGRYSNDVSSLFRIIDVDGMIPSVDAVEFLQGNNFENLF